MSCDRQGIDNLNLARCEVCPLGKKLRSLGEFAPVPAEINDSDVIVVGGSPERQDTLDARPFIGPTGARLLSMLNDQGRDRSSVSWSNVVACRFPQGKPEKFYAWLKKTNKRRLKNGDAPLPTPESCCSPRLKADLATAGTVLAVGSMALAAVGVRVEDPSDPTGEGYKINGRPSLTSYLGAPAKTSDGMKLLATREDFDFNPMWRPVVAAHLAKVFRYARGRLTWQEPEMRFYPRADDVEAFVAELIRDKRTVAVDVETAPTEVISVPGKPDKRCFDAMTDPLRCVGFGTQQVTMVVPYMSVSKGLPFYSHPDWQRIQRAIRTLLHHPDVVKVGHNIRYYDWMVLEGHGLCDYIAPCIDTHPLHKLGEAEYPHGLGFLGQRHTDAPAWKSEHTATEAESDEELWHYNARDLKVNLDVVKPVVSLAQGRDQAKLYKRYEWLQDVCRGMHRLGLRVDEEKRQQHEVTLEAELARQQARIDEVLGDRLNPRSTAQVGELLFRKWALPPQEMTKTGEPSTGETSMILLLANPLTTPEQRQVIAAIRKYRKAATQLSTFIRAWAPGAGLVRNGRIHPDYNAAGTVGWRFSSSAPNFQNIPGKFRDVFIAGDGYRFVEADFDQLELRLAAAYAEADYYIEAFNRGDIDPHNLSGELIFGQDYWSVEGAPDVKWEKGGGAFSKRRDLVKRFVYAALYGAKPPTIRDVLIEAEDREGKLVYLDLSVRKVRAMHRAWLRRAPEFKRWWDKTVKGYRRKGYIEEPIWGLRRYFDNGEDWNAIINSPVQYGGAAIVHTGMQRLVDGPLRFDFNAGTGLVMQVHDSLVFRVREDQAEGAFEAVQNLLPVHRPDLGITFTAEPSIGTHVATK